MHINPQLMMNELEKRAEDLGVNIQWSHPIDSLSTAPNIGSKVFDWVIDCRGLGARSKTYLNQLRGVRGEALLVHAPEVHLSRPVRVLHPRYALYVVPRGRHRYYLGATQIESESDKKITVRSSLEILSATFALHSGFAEAQIEKSFIGLRPAFDDNLPNIRYWQSRRLISLNGLFRHGFLLAPALCEVALNLIQDQPIVSCMDKIIIEEQEFYD
jgi:glycine oxidase